MHAIGYDVCLKGWVQTGMFGYGLEGCHRLGLVHVLSFHGWTLPMV